MNVMQIVAAFCNEYLSCVFAQLWNYVEQQPCMRVEIIPLSSLAHWDEVFKGCDPFWTIQ